MRIFHIATAADWRSALAAKSYTTSTLGRTLAEEGFLHAARHEQLPTVFTTFYQQVREPLVLLTIETDKLISPWQEDVVGDATYPHIYGPLNPSAVVNVQPLDKRGEPMGFTTVFVREIFARVLPALLAMVLAAVGAGVGYTVAGDSGESVGALVGLALGVLLFVVLLRRRR